MSAGDATVNDRASGGTAAPGGLRLTPCLGGQARDGPAQDAICAAKVDLPRLDAVSGGGSAPSFVDSGQTHGLLRPKGTDLARWDAEDIEAVANTRNNRARKTLGWKTPAEALSEHALLPQQAGVATTGCVRSIALAPVGC